MFSRRSFLALVCGLLSLAAYASAGEVSKAARQRFLYVASPGVRDYLEWGGHGVLVFDIDNGHKFVKRISLKGYGEDASGKPINVKGICANAKSERLYVSTLRHLIAIDIASEKVLWQKSFDLGCDRMAISPDGAVIYMPSLEKEAWYAVDATDGKEIKRLVTNQRSHNTVFGLDGKRVYLAGLGSPHLTVATTEGHNVERRVGPFGDAIRPFTVNGKQTLVFVNVNGLLGFEVGDLVRGTRLHRVEVTGVKKGPPKRHGCPSHGVGLTPDEKEIWVCDAFNSKLHIFDASVMPPKQGPSIDLREQPGWVTFSLDGKLAYPSTGEVIDVASRKIIATLTDEENRPVHSEKVLEIDFQDGIPVENGDQFGVGRVVK